MKHQIFKLIYLFASQKTFKSVCVHIVKKYISSFFFDNILPGNDLEQKLQTLTK
jgi:hypothetical protein